MTIVYLEAGLIMKSPLARFVEALFWTTLRTYALYEQQTVIQEGLSMPRPFCVYNRYFSSQSPREYHIIDVIDKFAMDAKCSFSELRKSKSHGGDFRSLPFAMRRLLECKDDVTGHLQNCHLSKRCGQSADVRKYSN